MANEREARAEPSLVGRVLSRERVARHVIEPPSLPAALYRVQGFDVALENRPEGIVAFVLDVPGVTTTAASRSEVLELIRAQLAPFWKPSALD